MSSYECQNVWCVMVGVIDGRRVCLGCKRPKARVVAGS